MYFSILFTVTDGLQPVSVAGMKRKELDFAGYWRPCSIKALHKERKLRTLGTCPLNGERWAGSVCSIPGAGNGAWVSWALSPASQLLMGTQACVVLFGLLIFDLWCVIYFSCCSLEIAVLLWLFSWRIFELGCASKWNENKHDPRFLVEAGILFLMFLDACGLTQSLEEEGLQMSCLGFQNCPRLQIWLFFFF